MLSRVHTGLLLMVLGMPALVWGGEKKATAPPNLVIRIRNLDTVLQHARLLTNLAGRGEIARQVEGLIRTKVGAKGLEGIDATRPMGVYAVFGKEIDSVRGTALVPVADEKAMLELIGNLGIKTVCDPDGIHTVVNDTTVKVYFRFAHRYLYIAAIAPDGLRDGNLLPPGKILGEGKGPALDLRVKMDQLPEAALTLAAMQLEEELKKIADAPSKGESAAQRGLRQAALQEMARAGAALLKEGAELRASLDITEKDKLLDARVAVLPRKGSSLEKDLKTLAQSTSLFAGLAKEEAAAQVMVHLKLPAVVQESVLKLFEEIAERTAAGIRDEGKRRQAQRLLDAFLPTVKAGRIDGLVRLEGLQVDRQGTVLAALRLEDGDKLEKEARALIQEMLKEMPKDLRAGIQLDAEEAGGIKIHRFALGSLSPGGALLEGMVKVLLGDGTLYLAVRKDALFAAVGRNALTDLQGALTAKGAAPAPLLRQDVDMGRVLKLLAESPEAKKTLDATLGTGQEATVRLRLESSGEGLAFRLLFPLALVEYFTAEGKK